VLRGEDHLTNTPRQLLLLRALGMEPPQYGHLGLVVDQAGAPLSKRRGDISLRALRERGYLAMAVVNYLARLGFSGLAGELCELDVLARCFNEHQIARGPAQYDEGQLQYWQRQALQKADKEVLWAWFGASVHALVPLAQRDAFIAAVRGNVLTPEMVYHWAAVLFTDTWPVEAAAQQEIDAAGSAFYCAAVDGLRQSPDGVPGLREAISKATGRRGKALFAPLRAALTGALHGPDLADLMVLIGRPQLEERLKRWCKA